ncbi:MAG TPA: hypothetical protein VF473_03395, partial [Cyclobacteriaceae bacterium]
STINFFIGIVRLNRETIVQQKACQRGTFNRHPASINSYIWPLNVRQLHEWLFEQRMGKRYFVPRKYGLAGRPYFLPSNWPAWL